MNNLIKQCTRCVLDTNDDPEMVFNQQGICNYCTNYEIKYGNLPSFIELEKQFLSQIETIKKQGVGKKYDCILGVSGGVDSTYLAMLAKKHQIKTLLIHFDNGWNSELAVFNIEKIVNYTGFDLYTYVVDWEEFKDLQLSYIKAGVLDWEIPTDHGFIAMLFKLANKFAIKNILTGHNYQTEAILPKSMRWSKMDLANLLDIHKIFGNKKLKSFPTLGFIKYIYYLNVKKIKRINLLEYIEYNKDKVKEEISTKLGWRDYGGKHYESIFTRFYQGFVLINKFGKDKRKAHLSNLICSGQLTKPEAEELVKQPAYLNEQLLNNDRNFVIKKLDLTEQEFSKIMLQKPIPHSAYKSYETGLYRQHEKIMKYIKPLTKLLKMAKGK